MFFTLCFTCLKYETLIYKSEVPKEKSAWWSRGKDNHAKAEPSSGGGEELGWVGRLKERRARSVEAKERAEKEKDHGSNVRGENDVSDAAQELGFVGRLKERRRIAREKELEKEKAIAEKARSGRASDIVVEGGEEKGWVGRLKERRARSVEAKEKAKNGVSQEGEEKGKDGSDKNHTKKTDEKIGWWGKAKKRLDERKNAKQFEEEILKSSGSSLNPITQQPKKEYRSVNDVVKPTVPMVSTRDDGFTRDILEEDRSTGYQ